MQCTKWVPVQDIERAYNSNPYHNNIHAADVTQTLGCFLANDDFAQKLTDLEVAAMIFATCIHDVGHPGRCLPHVPLLCLATSLAVWIAAVAHSDVRYLKVFVAARYIVQDVIVADMRAIKLCHVDCRRVSDCKLRSIHCSSVMTRSCPACN